MCSLQWFVKNWSGINTYDGGCIYIYVMYIYIYIYQRWLESWLESTRAGQSRVGSKNFETRVKLEKLELNSSQLWPDWLDTFRVKVSQSWVKLTRVFDSSKIKILVKKKFFLMFAQELQKSHMWPDLSQKSESIWLDFDWLWLEMCQVNRIIIDLSLTWAFRVWLGFQKFLIRLDFARPGSTRVATRLITNIYIYIYIYIYMGLGN